MVLTETEERQNEQDDDDEADEIDDAVHDYSPWRWDPNQARAIKFPSIVKTPIPWQHGRTGGGMACADKPFYLGF